MSAIRGSIESAVMSEHAIIADSSIARAAWLRPEFSILQRRFDHWNRELRELTQSDAGSSAIASVLNEPIQRVAQVADTIETELRRFWHGDDSTADPEDLRRLLTHGQQLSVKLIVRFSSLDEMQRVRVGLAAACDRLLHVCVADDRNILGLIDSLRQSAAAERPWTLWDPTFTDVSPAAVRDARVLAIGVPAGRLAARVAKRLGFSFRETVAAVYAALFQDCGYLLRFDRRARRSSMGASSHRRIDPALDDRVDTVDEHPRYGASLAAGLANIPTESLAAIAGHHAAATQSVRGESTRARRVDHLVAVVSAAVEEILQQGIRQSDSPSPLGWQTPVGGFKADVAAALESELAIATADTDFTPAAVAPNVIGSVPAPRFLHVSPRAADHAVRVS